MNKIKDTISIVKKLTLRKFYNGFLLITSYYFSKLTKKAVHFGYPISLSFEPTTSCNLRCPECPSGLRSFTRPTGMLQTNIFNKTIDEVHRDLLYLIFYFQGEPYLNPQFLEMVKYASSKNIYTATSTNAHYLNDENCRKTIESGLHRLIISIDGTSQQTYSAYRVGGSLQKVIDGTKNIIKWKKQLNSNTPHIIFQYLVVKPNEHQLNEVEALAKELGVNEVRFKTAQIYDYQNGSDLIPTIAKYARYKKNNDGTYSIKNKLENHCWKMWHSCVVTWDGKVLPCCFDKDATHSIGELKSTPFNAIWKSMAYNNFRASVLKSRSEIEMCKNCTEGTTVFA